MFRPHAPFLPTVLSSPMLPLPMLCTNMLHVRSLHMCAVRQGWSVSRQRRLGRLYERTCGKQMAMMAPPAATSRFPILRGSGVSHLSCDRVLIFIGCVSCTAIATGDLRRNCVCCLEWHRKLPCLSKPIYRQIKSRIAHPSAAKGWLDCGSDAHSWLSLKNGNLRHCRVKYWLRMCTCSYEVREGSAMKSEMSHGSKLLESDGCCSSVNRRACIRVTSSSNAFI